MRLTPDINELLLATDPTVTCETYIFEPSEQERSLGSMVAVAETADRGGIGRELIDVAISAIQREYYRQPSRGVLASFESALHQANLVLHDVEQQGVRDWMGDFHVAVALVAGNVLHLSVAGDAAVLLVRRAHVNTISFGLSHSPITNPLKTFSQVASGTIAERDTVFIGTSQFVNLFSTPDISRLSIDHSASTISLRLQQLYSDQGSRASVAGVVVSILPEHIVTPRKETTTPLTARRPAAVSAASPLPRRPLLINQTKMQQVFKGTLGIIKMSGVYLYQKGWPLLKRTSASVGRTAQSVASRSTQAVKQSPVERFSGAIRNLHNPIKSVPHGLKALPRSSKIFAVLTVILAVAFIGSLVFLRHKRTNDDAIQRASELLHEAQTKEEAATTALIYNNRDQATQLLSDADKVAAELAATGLYTAETKDVQTKIQVQRDRLQKIVRVPAVAAKTIGDFTSKLASDHPMRLFFVNGNLYTFNPTTNAVISLDLDGHAKAQTTTTQGLDFFTTGTTQNADKMLVLASATGSIATFDTKTALLQPQDMSAPSSKPELTALATFGNRLYIYDKATTNIYGYTKTLRGYAGGTAWIQATDFPSSSITDIAVDGYVYTLHNDGVIRRLLKGEVTDFKTDTVEPALKNPTQLIASDSLANLYILDTTNKRVVVFTKKGVLVQQIFFSTTDPVTAMALSEDEKAIYLLSGTTVVALTPGS